MGIFFFFGMHISKDGQVGNGQHVGRMIFLFFNEYMN